MTKILFDSHAHLNNETYKKTTRENLIQEIYESDVAYVMDVGFDLESSYLAYEHARVHPWCYAVVGFHPHEADRMSDEDLQLIKNLAQKPKVMAIGEIGLDYFRNLSPPEIQRDVFRKQIRLALELKKPIVIHDRDASKDVMDILKEEGVFSGERAADFPGHKDGGPDARLLMHCYSGSREMAEQYVKLGATISLAGPVTYKNARKPQEVALAVPLERLLIETDAPYLTPEPFRGRPNKSPYVEYTARKIADLKGLSYEGVAAATLDNAKRFFGIS